MKPGSSISCHRVASLRWSWGCRLVADGSPNVINDGDDVLSKASRLSATRGTKSMFREGKPRGWKLVCIGLQLEVHALEILKPLTECFLWGTDDMYDQGSRLTLCHAGRYISVGLEEELGMSPADALAGVRPAVWAALKMTSLMALCLKILSPLPYHSHWWSLDGSACPLHTGQEKEVLKSGTPSQYCKQQENRASEIL